MKRKHVLVAAGLLLAAATADAQRYVPPEPEHAKYLNARCRGLLDAMRHAQGLQYQTLAGMRDEYVRECAENDADARRQVYQGRVEKRNEQRASQAAEVQAQKSNQMKSEQCAESRRILNAKKARTDLNEGEKADLQRFEQNYYARCG